MSDRDGHRYQVVLFDPEGKHLDTVSVAPDFEPALEWARLQAMRAGRLPARTGAAPCTVEPLWDSERGEPVVAGLRVVVQVPGGAPEPALIPRRFFHALASAASSGLVEAGKLEAGDPFRYVVCAFPARAARPAGGGDALEIAALDEPLPLVELDPEALRRRSTACGPEPSPDDLPVFIPQPVLDQVRARARAAGAVEIGGALLGRLLSAPGPELCVEVTAQIPAPPAEARETSFTFTPAAWSAVRAAMELRDAGEMLLGWYHSHPFFCRRCPEERRRQCRLSLPFLSEDDIHLQRTCFSKGFHLALLVADVGAAEPVTALFGWRRGLVTSRGFHAVTGAS